MLLNTAAPPTFNLVFRETSLVAVSLVKVVKLLAPVTVSVPSIDVALALRASTVVALALRAPPTSTFIFNETSLLTTRRSDIVTSLATLNLELKLTSPVTLRVLSIVAALPTLNLELKETSLVTRSVSSIVTTPVTARVSPTVAEPAATRPLMAAEAAPIAPPMVAAPLTTIGPFREISPVTISLLLNVATF